MGQQEPFTAIDSDAPVLICRPALGDPEANLLGWALKYPDSGIIETIEAALANDVAAEDLFPQMGPLFSAILTANREGDAASFEAVAGSFNGDRGDAACNLRALAAEAGTAIDAEGLRNIAHAAASVGEQGALRHTPAALRALLQGMRKRQRAAVAASLAEACADDRADVPVLVEKVGEITRKLASSGGATMINAASFEGLAIPARQEFVEGLIPARVVTIIGGDGATGKSLLAAQLAVSVCTRSTWAGRVVFCQGPVLFLSAEDDVDELHRRLAAILESQGGTFDQLGGLHLVSRVGEDALLATKTRDDVIEPTPLYHAIEASIRDIRPRLVVIDNLADTFGGEENSRVQARQFIGLLRAWCTKYDTSVVLLAHPSLSGMATGTGTSGSTGWNNSVRSRLYLERIKSGATEDDPDARVLRSKKANYGPAGLEIRLRWDRGVFKVHGEGRSVTALASESKADTVFVELLMTYTAQGRPVGATPGHSYAPALFAADKQSGGITKRAFTDAMNRLFNSGQVTIAEIGPPSKRRKHLVLARVAT